MEYTIRLFKPEDMNMLHKWNAAYSEPGPTFDMIPEDSSFVLEANRIPILFISMLCTNSKYAYLENYCGDPEFRGLRSDAVQYLIKHLESFAKERGYKFLMTFAYKPKLVKQFENYGFTKTLEGLTAFIRGI